LLLPESVGVVPEQHLEDGNEITRIMSLPRAVSPYNTLALEIVRKVKVELKRAYGECASSRLLSRSNRIDASSDELRHSLRSALIGFARYTCDPVAYLERARAELTMVLTVAPRAAEISRLKITSEHVAQAFDEVWPEVIAHFQK
jgi:hypothetical protein